MESLLIAVQNLEMKDKVSNRDTKDNILVVLNKGSSVPLDLDGAKEKGF